MVLTEGLPVKVKVKVKVSLEGFLSNHSGGVWVVSAALEALERLEDQDLKKIYVDGLDDETTGGEFLVEDERTGETRVVPSTFPQVPILLRPSVDRRF